MSARLKRLFSGGDLTGNIYDDIIDPEVARLVGEKPLVEWSEADVVTWCMWHHLLKTPKIVSRMGVARVDGNKLMALNHAQLKAIGFGDKKKRVNVIKAVEELVAYKFGNL